MIRNRKNEILIVFSLRVKVFDEISQYLVQFSAFLEYFKVITRPLHAIRYSVSCGKFYVENSSATLCLPA